MLLLDDKIVVYSESCYYKKEESGRKNNFVIWLDDKKEVKEFVTWFEERKKRVGIDLDIEIIDEKTKKSFIRLLTDISIFENEKVYGDRIVIFSFKNESRNNKKNNMAI